jgi:hypothetical protein
MEMSVLKVSQKTMKIGLIKDKMMYGVKDYENMPKATDRFYINYIGECYDDALVVEAILKNRTKAAEAASLLCAKLQEREARRNYMVQYLANKRGISFEDMWNQLLTGKYEPLSTEEFTKVKEMASESHQET